MEFLRKSILLVTICFCSIYAKAQISSAMQKAFENSYAHEGKKQYIEAISDIMPLYNERNYETNLRAGWLYYLAKNYPSSQQYYGRAVAMRPNSIEAKFGLIQPLSLLGSWDRVLEQYNNIIKIDEQNTQANYWTGVLLYNRKQYATAAKYFTRVITSYPFDYDSNHMLGWANLFLGKKAEAKACFELALLIKPGDSSSADGINRSK